MRRWEIKMKKGLCELVFILDRSGSMSGLEADTVGGFNSFVENQKKQEGECLVTVVLFNQDAEILYDRAKLDGIRKMATDDYCPGGMTALLDAVGSTVERISLVHKYARNEDVPEKTIFVITTDGMENASRKYSAKAVKALVELKKDDGWEFLFLGANIDAVSTAEDIGISRDRAAKYKSDKKGTAMNFSSLGKAVGCMRCSAPLDESWKEDIERYCDEGEE